jgi:hypothetical protein
MLASRKDRIGDIIGRNLLQFVALKHRG